MTGLSPRRRAARASSRGGSISPAVEEDIFTLAVAQRRRAARRLSVAGCRILARQFRARVEAHHALAVGPGRAQPGLPARSARAAAGAGRHPALGPTDPAALAWLATHWGTTDRLRQVVERPRQAPAGACRPVTASSATASSPPAKRRTRRSTRWRRAGRRCDFVLRPTPAD